MAPRERRRNYEIEVQARSLFNDALAGDLQAIEIVLGAVDGSVLDAAIGEELLRRRNSKVN